MARNGVEAVEPAGETRTFGTGPGCRLAVVPPLEPMLARLTRMIPEGDYVFEPKWDGFRCLAFCEDGQVELFSRNQRPLARYFPEVVGALQAAVPGCAVLDGELMIVGPQPADFGALLARLHPAASRVARLAEETPARFVVFDVLAAGPEDLTARPFTERRNRLLELLRARDPDGATDTATLTVTPATTDRTAAEQWLDVSGGGIDGVVAKAFDLAYEPGRRAMIKVKRERTADCVVAGFRLAVDRPAVASLLLGLFDGAGGLRHVGVASSFTAARRRELVDELAPLVMPLVGHPWEHGFLVGGGRLGHLPGAAGRWTPADHRDWIPVRPELVCEVAYDIWEGDRFRHAARFRHWRPDRDPASCTLEQMVPVSP
ncbi:MAG TPA: ATP-dependent DNA ligase [Acidimicrobiia bacterium]|nr:ATP-dependent DNA ligase [Acidimicrobiia bacterium]